MSSAERFALVTGAGSGIGRSITQALLSQGWTVCLVDVNQAAIDALAAGKGASVLAIATDIGRRCLVARTLVVLPNAQRQPELVNAGLLFAGDQSPWNT
jgi:NADP-dependent 3-hydroxy acid dehydrogenase YdfG